MQSSLFEFLNEDYISKISEKYGEPNWLHKRRLKAFDRFKDLPIEPDILFSRYSNLFGDLKISNLDNSLTDTIDNFDSNNSYDCIQVDRKITRLDSTKFSNSTITDIHSAISDSKTSLVDYFKKDIEKMDKFELLTESFFTSGVFIELPNNSVFDNPFMRIVYNNSSNIGFFNKNIINLGTNCDLSIVSEYRSLNNNNNTSNSIIGESYDISVGENSNLSVVDIQLFNQNIIALFNKNSLVKNDGKLTISSGHFGGTLTRTINQSFLDGKGSEVNNLEVLVGTDSQRFDIGPRIYHNSESTKGVVDVKGVLRDDSLFSLKGMNRINEEASDSDTYLGGHALLLGDSARANVIPGLEIENRNVVAKHLAAVAPIDEDQIFYLNSRGLDRNDAIELIITGFLEEIISKIPSNSIQDELRSEVITKWRKLLPSDQNNSSEVLVDTNSQKNNLVSVCKISDLEQNKLSSFIVNDREILLVKINEKVYATSGLCTHLPTKLDTGFINGLQVTCSLHLSKFNISDGKALNPPAEENLKIYKVQIIDDNIFIVFDDN